MPNFSTSPSIHLLFNRSTRLRALKVSAVVGTILIAINQSDLILSGVAPPLWKIGLTYLVPYCVSSYSSVMMMLEQLQASD